MFKTILNKLSKISTGLVVVASAAFIRFVYAPLELFFTNRNEFWFDIVIILPFIIAMFCVMFLLGAAVVAIAYRISDKLYYGITSITMIYFLATYAQGTFFVSKLPQMDGRTIDWSSFAFENVKTIVVYVILASAMIVGTKLVNAKKMLGAYRLVAICISLMLLVTLITVCITNKAYESSSRIMVTNEGEYEFSKDGNVIVFMLDTMDGEKMSEMLLQHPEHKEILEDFTFYEDTVGAYPYTLYSIPYVLSGKWFCNETDKREYFNQFLNESNLIKTLNDRKYKIQLYDSQITTEYGIKPKNIVPHNISNVVEGRITYNSPVGLTKMLIKMGGVKFAPYFLKSHYYSFMKNAGPDVPEIFDHYTLFNWDNSTYYDEYTSKQSTYTDRKVFKFIHLYGAHAEYVYDSDGSLLPEDRLNEGSYEKSLEACLVYMNQLLDRMKKAGVYDNSAIIIMSDHGLYDGDTNVSRAQNPALFVKGIGEKHDFKISHAPISFSDFQDAFINLMDGKVDDEVFSAKEGDVRERRFIWYVSHGEKNMEEYIQYGHSSDISTLKKTGNIYKR